MKRNIALSIILAAVLSISGCSSNAEIENDISAADESTALTTSSENSEPMSDNASEPQVSASDGDTAESNPPVEDNGSNAARNDSENSEPISDNASEPQVSASDGDTAESNPPVEDNGRKAAQNDEVLKEVSERLGINYEESSDHLLLDYNAQVEDIAWLVNNNFGFVRSGNWGRIMYDTLDSLITGEYKSSLNSSNDPSESFTAAELQNHLRYCIFYGFEHIEEPDLQLPSAVYQNFLNHLYIDDGFYMFPNFNTEAVTDITLISETKDFGNNIQSQLTMILTDGTDTAKVYFTVLSDDSGKHYRFLDIEATYF